MTILDTLIAQCTAALGDTPDAVLTTRADTLLVLLTELQRFNADLENRIVLLQARFAALGDTWQDQEHEKFSEEFIQAMKALKKFAELSRNHTPYLLRKAQRIEEYLNQR